MDLKRVLITPKILMTWRMIYKPLSHVLVAINTKGYVYLDMSRYAVIGFGNTEEKDGNVWIQALEVNPEYRAEGFGKKILKDLIQDFDAKYLSVRKTNGIAIYMYKKYGFKTIDETDDQYIMKLDTPFYSTESTKEKELKDAIDIVPKNISKLYESLKPYDYGVIDDGMKKLNLRNYDFYDDYNSMNLSDFRKYKIGVCFDFTHYEANWFKKHGYDYTCYYIEANPNNNNIMSHSFLIFKLKGMPGVYWFEKSWGKYKGIWHFNSEKECLDTVIELHARKVAKCDPSHVKHFKYDAASDQFEGLHLREFMLKASKGKSFYKTLYESYQDDIEVYLVPYEVSNLYKLL